MPNEPTWADTVEDFPSWEETTEDAVSDDPLMERAAMLAVPSEIELQFPQSRSVSTIAGGPQLRRPGDLSFGREVMQGIREIPQAAGQLTEQLVTPILAPTEIEPRESVIGLTREIVPTGAEITRATGVPKWITTPVSGIGRTAAGFGEFLTSPAGIADIGVAAIPGIGLVQRAKFIKDMAEGAGQSAGAISPLVEKALKDPSSITTEEAQQLAEGTADSLLMLLGAGKLTSHQFSQLTGIRAPLGRILESEKTRLAKDLAEQLKQSEPIQTSIERPAVRQLGIPQTTLTAEPFLQPGIPELAGAALREAQVPRLEIPGEMSALETLRRELSPPRMELVEPTRLAERVPERGETAVTPAFEGVQVQPRVLRSASDVLLERSTMKGTPEPGVVAPAVPSKTPSANPQQIASETGFTYDAAMEQMVPNAWHFTDNRPDSPTRGLSVAVAKGSGPADVQKAIAERVEKGYTPPVIPPAPESTGTPDIISKLESLKFPETGEGRLYSIPHPDAVSAIGRSAWNSAVDVAIAAVKAGKAIAQAVDDAIGYLRKNVKDFDEAKARANIEYVTRQEIRQTIPSTESEVVQMRKSAERATTSPMVPEPVQERIAEAPESFYRQQSMARVEDVVSGMNEGQLSAVPRDSNVYTAARLEQAKRLFDRGENEAGYRVFEELEKEGTLMGQLINQFKLLKGSRPENIVRVLNQKLKQKGKDILTEKQQKEVIDKATESKQKDAELDKATDVWTKDPTPESASKAETALMESNATALELQRIIGKYEPRSLAAILKSILQGALLTPISQVANIVGNMSLLPFRAMARTTATTLDILDNAITKRPRTITVQPVAGAVEAVKGLGRGAKQIPDILLRGTGNVIKGETRAGLHPLKAWINQFAKNPEMPTVGGKLTFGDRLNLAIEGTFGIPAEVMLRGLGAGDVAFKEAARARITAEQLKLAKVPRDQWSFAQKFPELFLDEVALERIQSETLAAIFQRPSRTLNLITNFLKSGGDTIDFFAATVAPYKLTPWNIIGEYLSYNPLIAAARTVYSSKKGDRRAARMNAGKYVVGSMLAATGWWLYKKGIMSPSLDERDETQKARVAAGEVVPPNHINLSGLRRAMAGGDPSFQPGDETVDVFRGGGLAGSMFYMTANIGRDFERRPDVADSEIWMEILRQSSLEQARFGMNQSFLSGVEGMLSAIKDGNADNYLTKWMDTVASIPMPNSMKVLSRATREYKPDFREDTIRKQFENLVRNKLGFAGLDDYLPLKRDLWGEPMPETPEGRNAFLYHFFDISKNRQVTSDPVKLELFRLWRKTADNRILPPLPEKTVTFGGVTYPLTAAQQSRYAELVGKERRKKIETLMFNPNFHTLTDEKKIDLLDRRYRSGLQSGKSKFKIEELANLTPKASRSGFQSK